MTYTLGKLAAFLGGELGPADLSIEGLAPIDQATPREITFITQRRFARLVDREQAPPRLSFLRNTPGSAGP